MSQMLADFEQRCQADKEPLQIFTDDSKSMLTYDYFLESSKLIYTLYFMSQKQRLEEGTQFRRQHLSKALGNKDKKTDKKVTYVELEQKISDWETAKQVLKEMDTLKNQIESIKRDQQKLEELAKEVTEPVDVDKIKQQITDKENEVASKKLMI